MSRTKLTVIVALSCLLSASLSAGAVWFFQGNYGSPRVEFSNSRVPDFALLDQSGRYHRLSQYQDAKAVVIFSYQPSCSIADDALRSLAALQERYADKAVIFLMINGGLQTEQTNVPEQGGLAGIKFPVLVDRSQLVSEALGLLNGGEALLLDPKSWRVHFRGPVQSWKSSAQTEPIPYLEKAIEAVLGDARVETAVVSETRCLTRFADNFYQNPVSYNGRIVPIIKDRCTSCHRTSGVAPWSMDSHEALKIWSSRIREVLLTRKMPPWHADPNVGEFSYDRSLSIAERQDLVHWINAGAENQESFDSLRENPPIAQQHWSMGSPDLILDLPKQKLPPEGIIPYRWAKLSVPIESDAWIRAVELKPSNASVMHHGFVFVIYPASLKSKQPKWLEGRNGFFTAFVPGINVLPLPKDSGQFLPVGSTLIFQLHYVTKGVETEDNPKLALYFHDAPPASEYKIVSASNMAIRIPPHAAEHKEQAETVITEDALLQGFYPHMHYRGKWFQYEAVYPDGRTEKLLSVPSYDIHWQTFYRLKNPKPLPRGTRIVVNSAFDNSSNNPVNPDPTQEVEWGLKSSDEMLVGYLMYTRDRK